MQRWLRTGDGSPHIGLVLHDRGDENSSYAFLIDYVNEIAAIREVGRRVMVVWYAHILQKLIHGMNWKPPFMKMDALSFRINDFTNCSAIDRTPLEGGKAGLIVGNARARFDDFQITGENIPNGGPGKSRPVAPQAKLATTWGRLKMK